MTEPRTTVYTPDSSLASPGVMVRDMMRDIAVSRELAWTLAVRDIRAQYRQTLLGIAWAFLVPLGSTLTWVLLQGTGVVKVAETPIPYPIYVFVGTMLWAILMDAMNAPLGQTQGARSLLAKLKFPREALLMAGILKVLFNGGIKLALVLVALLFLGNEPGWGILLFPIGILSLILVGTTLGLLVTPVGMLYTDVGRALPMAMQFVMYLTPVVFPMPKEGAAATLFQINPLSPLILTARDWLTGMNPEHLVYFAVVNIVAFIMLLAVWTAYRLAMPILIERMSA